MAWLYMTNGQTIWHSLAVFGPFGKPAIGCLLFSTSAILCMGLLVIGTGESHPIRR